MINDIPVETKSDNTPDKWLLSADNVSRVFEVGGSGRKKQRLQALSDVTIGARQAEIVGIVGESGCGKSTLGRVLGGLISPSDGTVKFNNQNIQTMNSAERKEFRRAAQFVFQDPFSSLDPRFSIGESITEGMRSKDYGGKQAIRDSLFSSLEKVGMSPDIIQRKPHEFSGGQRQRIGIARALIRQPQIIIADEPVAALDVSLQAQVVNLLKDLKASESLTILFISHNLAVVGYLADRVIVMYLGTVVEEGPATEVTLNPKHPYTKALISAVPSMDLDAPARQILQGEIPSPISPPTGCRFRTRCPIAQDICAEVSPTLKTVGKQSVACHFVE